MAKQDLVVKLLLDSGAFGANIKEAERKAKEFSDNMKNAGKTAGGLSKELGLSVGAIGKLGGVLTGAGGVVAAFGAFKSIMESTHTSSKAFKSTIAGFEGVFTSLQRSIASMDFSTLHGGFDELFRRHKEYKEALMDEGLKGVAYNYLFGETESKFKEFEVEFKDKKTSDERREEIKKELDVEIKMAEMRLKSYRNTIYETLNKGIKSLDGKIKGFDGEIKGLGDEMVSELIHDALDISLNDDAKKIDKELYEGLKERYRVLEKALGKAELSLSQVNDQLVKAPKNGLLLSSQAFWQSEVDKAKADMDAFINDIQNQKIFFRNAIYTLGEEELGAMLSKANEIQSLEKQYSELKKLYGEMTAPTKTVTASTKTGGGGGNEQLTKSSMKWYEEEISKLSKARDNMLIDTPEFELATTKLQLYTKALQELQSTIASMDKNLILTPLQMSGGYDPKATLDTAMKNWRDTYKPTSSITDTFEDMNIAITSSISLLDSLSSAFSAMGTDSSRAIGGVIGVFSDLGQGIMDFIAIQQAASAAKGVSSAAGLPFPYNLAAIATVISTVVSVFANIKSMTAGKFAEGGIVGGQSYSGDKLFAMVNSGEMILNKRQQANLSNMLGSGGRVEFHISGDSLVGVLTNKTNKNKLIR